jgi:signal transduction histidine kinase
MNLTCRGAAQALRRGMDQDNDPSLAAKASIASGGALAAAGKARGLFSYISPRTGLQGKLVLCFMFLLTVALGASCWLFVSETRDNFGRMAGDEARQLSQTLAMASETPLERSDAAELQRIGAELMKNKRMVAVVFFDANGHRLAVAARNPELERPSPDLFTNPRDNSPGLMELKNRTTPTLGRYVELTTPVTRVHARAAGSTAAARPVGQAVGYLTVCVSQDDVDARARNTALLVLLIGAVAVLVSLPTMYLLVHRIFTPIRELVAATDRIAAGDMDTTVAIDRPDVIGTLARSFNQMIVKVRGQQRALELANDQLEEVNGNLADANYQLGLANRDLEEKVRRRTTQLEQANARLSAEMTDKDDFLRTVSHDLNAPLRNISGMAAMLLMKHRDTFDPDVVHRLERIQRNVEMETDLIGELLELSRIKSRRQKFEDVAVGELVLEIGEMFAQDLETRNITLAVDTPMPTLACERARMRQIFQNLVDNAIKYMGEGSERAALEEAGHTVPDSLKGDGVRVRAIHVGCRAREDDVEFYVRDTGMGIDPQDVGNVFRVFRRGRSEAVQHVAGKGVGLASVKSIIETYGGTIKVESRLGAGSTFRFTIDSEHLAGESGRDASKSRAA